MIAFLASLRPEDAAGLALLIGGFFAVGWLIEHPPHGRPSVSVLMQRYRREWMRHFVAREVRIFDGNILSSLREGTAFFASASMIAIGGGLALMGNVERLRGLTREFDLTPADAGLMQVKLAMTLAFLAHALMKFIWAHRLFGYCAIVMASVPDTADHPQAQARADQAADLNIAAARHFTTGLRSIYFALGALGWLAGGWGLIAGAALVLGLTVRREFASGSRDVILRALPPPRVPGLDLSPKGKAR